MDWTGCGVVEVIPGKVSGAPLVKASRVQADTVLESFVLGESPEEIAYSYSLEVREVLEVLRFAAARALAKTA